MLAELLVYAASYRATPPAFRRHLGEAIGLWARGQRQTRAWAPHLANSRGLIDTTIDDLDRRRTVVVLGSGPLFDVPVESLARTFERVILVDQAHLSTIAVARSHRRLGIATRLLQFAIVEAGGVRVDLITDEATDFYASLRHQRWSGFRIYPPFA